MCICNFFAVYWLEYKMKTHLLSLNTYICISYRIIMQNRNQELGENKNLPTSLFMKMYIDSTNDSKKRQVVHPLISTLSNLSSFLTYPIRVLKIDFVHNNTSSCISFDLWHL